MRRTSAAANKLDLFLPPGVYRCRCRCTSKQIVYDQEVDTLNQAHEEQREEEKQNSEQKMNEVQVTRQHIKEGIRV